MTLCPVALAVGCRKCPVFSVCPAKGIIGDYKGSDDAGRKKSGRHKDEGKRGGR